MKTLQKNISLVLVASILLTICPFQSNAKWRDRSDELPGMASDGSVVAVAAAGVVVVGALVFLLIKSKKKQELTRLTVTDKVNLLPQTAFSGHLNENVFTTTLGNPSKTGFSTPKSTGAKPEAASRALPVELLLKPMNSGPDMAFNSQSMQVGIRIRF